MRRAWRLLAVLLLGGCSPFIYHSPEATVELRSAMAAANDARVDGPARVQIAARTMLFVQTGVVYIPAAQAERLLRATGRRPTREMLGLLITSTPERTDAAILYSRSRPAAELPELDAVNWREAPELFALRSR